ncbi:hypothetical protein U6G28_09990 [Actinomycetaceae bacterium MB13-C1-2]|nr:hypothetical protein U6G28_09990 [Actinomycetaceae bacterium MB13-C1-2]
MKNTGKTVLTVVTVFALLYVGSFLTKWIPDATEILSDRSFTREAVVGETVEMRTGDVTVTGVQATQQVEIYGQVATTDQTWLVIDVQWTPHGESGIIGGSFPVIRSKDGRTFGGMQTLTANCGPTPPGLTVWCQMPFEIPTDALEGSKILIPAGGQVFTSDDVAQIDLQIDAATASQLTSSQERILLQDSTSVIP